MSEIKENKKVTFNDLLCSVDNMSSKACNKIELLPHNQMLYDKIVNEIEKGEHNIFYSEATGLGKSFVFMRLVQDYFKGKRILYIVPKIAIWENLIRYKEFSDLDTIIEMKTFTAFNKYECGCELVDDYDAVFVDECHHLLSEIQGLNIALFMEDMKKRNKYSFGFTATPRFKGVYVDEYYFDVSCYGYDVFEAIEEEIFPKIDVALTNIDLESVPDNLKAKFSFTGNKSVIQQLIEEYSHVNKWLAYFSTVEDLEAGVNECKLLFPGFKLLKLYSGISNIQDIINEYENSNNVILLSVGMLLEGMHLQGVGGVLLFRNVHVETVYMQIYGRLCRIGQERSPIFLDISNSALNLKDTNLFKSPRAGERKNYVHKDIFDVTSNGYRTVELLNILEELNLRFKPITDIEREVITEYYAIEGNNVLKRLPGCSEARLRRIAHILGIRREFSSDDIDNTIREYFYSEDRVAVLTRSTGKNWDWIRHRAKVLGLDNPRKETYLDEETVFIQSNYTTMSDIEIADALNIMECNIKRGIKRTAAQIADKRKRMGTVKRPELYGCKYGDFYKGYDVSNVATVAKAFSVDSEVLRAYLVNNNMTVQQYIDYGNKNHVYRGVIVDTIVISRLVQLGFDRQELKRMHDVYNLSPRQLIDYAFDELTKTHRGVCTASLRMVAKHFGLHINNLRATCELCGFDNIIDIIDRLIEDRLFIEYRGIKVTTMESMAGPLGVHHTTIKTYFRNNPGNTVQQCIDYYLDS